MNISTTNSTLQRVVDNNNFPNCNNNISSKMTAQVQSKHAPKVHPLVRSGINIWIEFNSRFPGRERHSRWSTKDSWWRKKTIGCILYSLLLRWCETAGKSVSLTLPGRLPESTFTSGSVSYTHLTLPTNREV